MMSDVRLIPAQKIENYALPALLRKHPTPPTLSELRISASQILRDLFSVYNEEDINAFLDLATEEYGAIVPTLPRREILKAPRSAMTAVDQLRGQITEVGKKADQFVIEHGATISNIALGVAGVMRSYSLFKQIIQEVLKEEAMIPPQRVEIDD